MAEPKQISSQKSHHLLPAWNKPHQAKPNTEKTKPKSSLSLELFPGYTVSSPVLFKKAGGSGIHVFKAHSCPDLAYGRSVGDMEVKPLPLKGGSVTQESGEVLERSRSPEEDLLSEKEKEKEEVACFVFDDLDDKDVDGDMPALEMRPELVDELDWSCRDFSKIDDLFDALGEYPNLERLNLGLVFAPNKASLYAPGGLSLDEEDIVNLFYDWPVLESIAFLEDREIDFLVKRESYQRLLEEKEEQARCVKVEELKQQLCQLELSGLLKSNQSETGYD